MDRRASVYHDSIKTSSVQPKNQKYFKDRENQYIDMTQVSRRLYGQVTYSNQKQAYVFVENDAIVPTENSMYAIYHDPMKKKFSI